MNDERITLIAQATEIAESEDPDFLMLKFILSDFKRNKNGVRLDKEGAAECVPTMIGKPLVAKVRGDDFGSHEATTDDNGELNFNTSPLGYFTEASYDEENIYGIARVWKRYKNACRIIEKRVSDGVLNSSWELTNNDSHTTIEDGEPTKVISRWDFIGHCLLGSSVPPAYDCSRVLEVAEQNDSDEIAIAFAEDIENVRKEDEEKPMDLENNVVIEQQVEEAIETAEVEVVEEEPAAPAPAVEQAEEEVAALTERDIYVKIREAICERTREECGWHEIIFWFPEEHLVWSHNYTANMLDCVEWEYTVENDVVTLGERRDITLVANPRDIGTQMSERDATIAELNATVTSLNTRVAELEVFEREHNEAVAAAEAEKHAADVETLRQRAASADVFTDAELEEMAEMFENLDEAGVNAKIAEKVISNCKKKKASVDSAEAHVSVALETTSNTNPADIIRNFIFR